MCLETLTRHPHTGKSLGENPLSEATAEITHTSVLERSRHEPRATSQFSAKTLAFSSLLQTQEIHLALFPAPRKAGCEQRCRASHFPLMPVLHAITNTHTCPLFLRTVLPVAMKKQKHSPLLGRGEG